MGLFLKSYVKFTNILESSIRTIRAGKHDWVERNLKYFASLGYISIKKEKVIFAYKGIKRICSTDMLDELISMLDCFERMSRCCCSIISIRDRKHFIVSTKFLGNMRFIIPFPYSPAGIWACIQGIYNCADLRGKTVVDIGAYIGDTTVYYAKRGATVYAFEPFPPFFKYAKLNIKVNNVEDCVKLFNVAIADYNGRMKFRFNPDFFHSEAFGKYYQGKKEVEVECWTLKKALDQTSIKDAYLLKMDCEGCEFDIIQSSKDILPKFKYIILEYHLKSTGRHLNDLIYPLKSSGFSLQIVGDLNRGHIYAMNKSLM